MELLKPVFSIKNFTGMGDNGLYFLDGFVPKILQGQTILTQGWGSYSFIDSSMTNFSALSKLIALAVYQHISDNQILAMDDLGNMFDFNNIGINKKGIVNIIPTSGSISPCSNGGMLATRLGNVLYSSSNHLGVAWLGQATGGSTTTLINTAKNFSNLGVSSATGTNRVYNLTKGTYYTVSGVTTTTNPNDTLTISGVSAEYAPTAGDWYVAFVDTRFTYGTTSVANQHFSPQPLPTYWNRQIILWNDTYYSLNGNYIAALTTDESTWTSDLMGSQASPSDKYKKQLPTNHQAVLFDYNQDRMLVASYNQGHGALLLSDGYSPNWLSILEIDTVASGLIRYGSGWIVLIGASLYYTDGYSLQYLDRLPDSITTDVQIPKKSNMIATEDGLILSFYGSSSRRLVSGCYAYNIKNRAWSYIPVVDKNGKGNQVNPNIFVANKYDTTAVRSTPNYIISNTEIGKIVSKDANKSSVLMYIQLPQKMEIKSFELNVAPRNDNTLSSASKLNTVKVNYGEGLNPMYSSFTPGAGSTTTVLKNSLGASMKTRVGQQVFVPTGSAGYERSFITSIANEGTSSEELTISPALSAIPTSSVRVLDLYSAGSEEIASDSFKESPQFFTTSFYSDKLWLEIVFENQDDFPLDLNSVNIYA